MKPSCLVPLVLPLALTGACGGPPPKYATHACEGQRVVHMPLGCLEPADTLADQPDYPAAIRALLSRLAARTNGRPGEIIGGLVQEYQRIDADLRRRYTAACQAWTTPCDASQQASYQATVTDVRARNGRLRNLHAGVEELAGRVRWIEPGDEGARSVLSQLETASEELSRAPSP